MDVVRFWCNMTELWRQAIANLGTEVQNLMCILTHPDFNFFQLWSPPERPKKINIITHCQIMTPQNLGRLKCSWWTSNLFVGNFCHHLNCFDLNLIKRLEFAPFSNLFHESKWIISACQSSNKKQDVLNNLCQPNYPFYWKSFDL